MAPALGSKGRTNYAYAVARVQAKRSKLIPPREYEKILRMDVPEITRTIEESAYKTEVDELASKFTGLDLLEAALSVNEERAFQSVRQMVGGEGGVLVGLFLDRFIIEDLKTLLRGKAAGASRDELLREMLLENLDTYNLFQPLLAEDVRSVEDAIAALERQTGKARELGRILRRVPAGSPLPRYEDELEKAHYAGLLASLNASKQKGSTEFLEFVRREVDALNVRNAARWAAAGEEGDFTPFIIPGGKELKVAQVVALSRAKGLAAFAEALKETPLHEALAEGMERSVAEGRLAPFASAVQRHLLKSLDRLSHSHPLSVLPILLFLVRKHREVVTLRAVARGKAAGLSESRLQELLG
ncbi:MAG TPA: V-type ATPase subunit [Candidatus Thermoplasmatota archaeon]|nr:V-type ATPase subunit [Candidatus Thermoplasmatota archaeon]